MTDPYVSVDQTVMPMNVYWDLCNCSLTIRRSLVSYPAHTFWGGRVYLAFKRNSTDSVLYQIQLFLNVISSKCWCKTMIEIQAILMNINHRNFLMFKLNYFFLDFQVTIAPDFGSSTNPIDLLPIVSKLPKELTNCIPSTDLRGCETHLLN